MVITMWTIFIALLELLCIFPEAFLAFLAGKCHLEALVQRMVGRFAVTNRAVEPFAATWRADGDLSIENMFAVMRTESTNALYFGLTTGHGVSAIPHSDASTCEKVAST